ncbi:heme ABC exporter ATP-binding protein CcmA [Acetobacter sp. UBA5411]|uniref:heme ABC exporter ATP-binding protein CcmA n=1 Tax=Acetobacter sp. UBA5411 TaxID=1945905 RepID=UPI0025BE31ED|nr:heme ABC exporter ATP-binding protein CcmA [Acetobacter sp. UBA5411]
MLEARDITVFRGERLVLDQVSLSLFAGEAMLLTGPNGAGKSTLMRVLAGLRKPDSGELLWQGSNVFADRMAYAHNIAYLGHQDALKPGLTLRENLSIFAHENSLDEAFDSFDLRPLADTPVRLFSAGQKRRAALARVILAQAPLWLLDEPSLGLDVHSVGRLGEALRNHRQKGGMIIVTTHVPLPLEDVRHLTLSGVPADDWAGEFTDV